MNVKAVAIALAALTVTTAPDASARGWGIDPNGVGVAQAGDEGSQLDLNGASVRIDPNGLAAGDTGGAMDPNGLAADQGSGIDPNGFWGAIAILFGGLFG